MENGPELKPIAKELIFIFNEHKLMILGMLYKCRDTICGCDMVEKLGMSKDLLSYHLKTLRVRGYIEEVKCGRNKNYTIAKEKLELVKQVLNLTQILGKENNGKKS